MSARVSTSSSEHEANISNEIVSSERAYLDQLDLLIKLFVDPLSDGGGRPSPLSKSESRTLWGEVRSIRLVNQVLYDRCADGRIVDAFATLTPFLKLYSSYARNFPSAQQLLQQLLHKKRKFAVFIRSVEDSPACRGWKLQALLITPIQRIPRYKLLLESLLQQKEQNDCDDDVVQLTEVLCTLNAVAEYVNECVADHENTLKVIEVQRCLDACAPALLQPGRKLLKEGFMKKVARHGHYRVQRRMFWLFTDILLYGKTHPRKSAAYLCSCVLPLRHVYAERIFGTNQIRLLCKSERLLLQLDTFQEVNEWMECLNEAIRSLHEARITLRKESSKSGPQRRSMLHRLRARRTGGGGDENETIEEKWRRKYRKRDADAPPSVSDAHGAVSLDPDLIGHRQSSSSSSGDGPVVHTAQSRLRLHAAYRPGGGNWASAWRKRPMRTIGYVRELLAKRRLRAHPAPAGYKAPPPPVALALPVRPLRSASYYASVRSDSTASSANGRSILSATSSNIKRESGRSSASISTIGLTRGNVTVSSGRSAALSEAASSDASSAKWPEGTGGRKRRYAELAVHERHANDVMAVCNLAVGGLPPVHEDPEDSFGEQSDDETDRVSETATARTWSTVQSAEKPATPTAGTLDSGHFGGHGDLPPPTKQRAVRPWWETEAKKTEPAPKRRKFFDMTNCSLM